MSSNDPSLQPSPPALAAFLRGIERRAAVLAELQAGDAVAGDAAVAAAMRQWHAAAPGMTMGEWPERFWALLLAQPQLHVRTAVALPLDATDRLGELGTGPRAALLLRVAAGLDELVAAAALGVPVPSYRLALQNALPRRPDGSPDEGSWQRLRDQVHRRIKTLSPDRMSRLGNAREAVLQDEAPGPGASSGPVASRAQRRRGGVPIALWALLALCALALAATFLPGAAGWLKAVWPGGGDGDRARNLAVLPESPPASRFGTESGLIAHRDFALLADPTAAQARDLAFHSWLAAQPAAMTESPPPVAAADGHGADATTVDSQGITSESADAPS